MIASFLIFPKVLKDLWGQLPPLAIMWIRPRRGSPRGRLAEPSSLVVVACNVANCWRKRFRVEGFKGLKMSHSIRGIFGAREGKRPPFLGLRSLEEVFETFHIGRRGRKNAPIKGEAILNFRVK